MSGIRVIRNETNVGSNAILKSTGNTIVNVEDNSEDGSGDYILGVYVSGDNNKVILNNSDITLGKSGQYSSALKIGKGRRTGTGGGVVESHGSMVLDTTAENAAPTVRLIGTGSKLLADYALIVQMKSSLQTQPYYSVIQIIYLSFNQLAKKHI